MKETWEEQTYKEENQNEEHLPPFSGLSLKNLEEVYQNLETEDDNVIFRLKLLLIMLLLILLIIGLPTYLIDFFIDIF
jgi:hypothetical protein